MANFLPKNDVARMAVLMLAAGAAIDQCVAAQAFVDRLEQMVDEKVESRMKAHRDRWHGGGDDTVSDVEENL